MHRRVVRAPNSTTRLLSRLGDASYSTYLLHPLVIIPIVAIYLRIPAALHNPLVFVASAITVSTVIGLVVFIMVEKPITATLRQTLVNPNVNRWLSLTHRSVRKPAVAEIDRDTVSESESSV